MLLAFYGCHCCGEVKERKQWIKAVNCPKCGSRKFHPAYLSNFRVWVFVLLHPSYLIAALRGEE